MSPRGSKRYSVSPADARAYLAKAAAWLEAAEDNLRARRWDVAAGSAVTAGINASDAITGSLLGQRAGGEHSEALDLLTQAGEDGRTSARQLAQLLAFKAPAQYDPAPSPKRTLSRLSSWAGAWSSGPPSWSLGAAHRHRAFRARSGQSGASSASTRRTPQTSGLVAGRPSATVAPGQRLADRTGSEESGGFDQSSA